MSLYIPKSRDRKLVSNPSSLGMDPSHLLSSMKYIKEN